MKTTRCFVVVAPLLAMLGGPSAGAAACLVLRGGGSIEVRTAPRQRGGLVLFDDLNGKLRSMRLDQVAWEDTLAATRRGVCGAAAGTVSVGTPVRETSRPLAIAGPARPPGQPPTAREIVASMRGRSGAAPAGPPAGTSIDCSVVACGTTPAAAGAADAAPPGGDVPNPTQRTRSVGRAPDERAPPAAGGSPTPAGAAPPASQRPPRARLFGEAFRPGETAATSEASAPAPASAPRRVRRRKRSHG